MAKLLNVSTKQALIINYKSDINANSGIEAGWIITPVTDGTAQLLILAVQKPNENRVNLFPRTALTPRGITESAAQAKYMADLATMKTYFGLVNVNDTAAAIGLPQIKLDDGGIWWDPSVRTFPTPVFTSNETWDKVTADGTHKLLNYFNATTGVFDAAPVVAVATTDSAAKTFLGLTARQITIGSAIVTFVALVIIDPLKILWKKKKGGKK